ncbi:MAG: hypothetical protein DRN26_02900 [Thermoplasmata archaeon]|nr:MAG: hypothetical protein DRN26_02900 [Thermoplasmata archaeon]
MENHSGITVINKRDSSYKNKSCLPYKIYIGRPSILGNPFSVRKYGRSKCIQLFREMLLAALRASNPTPHQLRLQREIERLREIYQKHGTLLLECWCAPSACHGDVIKEILESS